jgi:hypothetical protein
MVPAGNAGDVHGQDTVANDGRFCCLHWKHSHSAHCHRMLVAIVDVFIRDVQVGQSVAPASSPPPSYDGLWCVVLQLACVSAAALDGSECSSHSGHFIPGKNPHPPPQCPVNRRLRGPQSRSGRFEDDKISCPGGDSNYSIL